MNKTIKWLSFLCLALIVAGCEKNYDGVKPGNYVAISQIGTFAGDTVLLSGQASNSAGLETIEIRCDAWSIAKVYDLKSQKPAVFNYDYQMAIPATATFPQEITVTVKSANGEQTVRTIPASFVEDTTAPVFKTVLSAETGVELDPELGYGTWYVSITATDDRELDYINLSIPEIDYDVTQWQEGRSGSFHAEIQFTTVSNYEATFTAVDAAGNESTQTIKLVVTPIEEQDPIDDFEQMYIFDADEDAAEYLDGYYHYMYRQDGGYKYKCNIRAFKDSAHFYMAPEKSVDGYIFGVSPYVSSKILNKKGYAVPVTIEKAGCYEFTVDILSQTYSITKIESKAIEGPFFISGVGFSNITDWGTTDEMVSEGNDVYSKVMGVDGAAATHQYYFYTDGWATIYRCDEAGWEWFIGADGACVKFTTEYDGDATFYLDTALPWGWVKVIK